MILAGCGGASFNGEEYPADKKGRVKVPPEAVADLIGHGFEVIPTFDEEDPETDEAKLDRLKKDVKNLKAAVKKAPEDAEKKAALDAAILALEIFTGKESGTEDDKETDEEIIARINKATTIGELYVFQVEGRSEAVENAINARGTELDTTKK